MTIELACCTKTLLREIADKRATRDCVARTYALALRSSEETDWLAANTAILERWSPYALNYIKELAHSGKCFREVEP